eukprot:TRINITY_DN41139_c0_g1_i1.p1 TRINITY_DN41139_c0_g1~~TRINITY_DN41139_c0_g1_i1.p1  ORF type:complete len:295 (+),score=42.15 TRINITY_DN41139_c0_g1_i1:593-1477(+)
MLRQEGTSAEKVAYDRPSPKLLGFLRRHFGLARYQPQSNHFVVFDAYFANSGAASRPGGGGGGAGSDGAAVPAGPVPRGRGVGGGGCGGGGAGGGGGGNGAASLRSHSEPGRGPRPPTPTKQRERRCPGSPESVAATAGDASTPQTPCGDGTWRSGMRAAGSPGATLSAAAPVTPHVPKLVIAGAFGNGGLCPPGSTGPPPRPPPRAAHGSSPLAGGDGRVRVGRVNSQGTKFRRPVAAGGLRTRSASPLCQAAKCALSGLARQQPVPQKCEGSRQAVASHSPLVQLMSLQKNI